MRRVTNKINIIWEAYEISTVQSHHNKSLHFKFGNDARLMADVAV
jgi:hypothetical protein